ncbi:MAG: MYG1 family protein [Planctomycetes bacterium]|nr:MYG1 family protein [Planctomycetota bacterium]
MPTEVATHSGSFHADDVLAFAMIRVFFDQEATVVRTRDLERIAQADIAIDVGGEFAPDRRRFDHHQASYDGDRSSAGMVLDWLEADGHIGAEMAHSLRADLVDYVDAVDNGRRTPERGVPCFAMIVGVYNNLAASPDEFDGLFRDAAAVAAGLLEGLRAGYQAVADARLVVRRAMSQADETASNLLFLDAYHAWKPAYFELGGADHHTEFVVYPAEDSWRVVAIPPVPGSFDQKRSLPAEWAGLVDDELSSVVGVNGARFCHKNRFIAVFESREAALESLRKWGLERSSA